MLSVGAVAVLAIFATMCHLLRKYRRSHNILRSLTDVEIDEFFQGKPELVTNEGSIHTDTVDFLPYDRKFEIPLDDLEFEISDDNCLGQGHFSNVVRGKVISKQLPVAIKVPQPSEDVVLFKSLLSEVKIMIYVGQHKNIISLIGVCTEGIKNRSVYIVSEVCELGSLHMFLRNARPNFINMLHPNHELDRSIMALAWTSHTKFKVVTTQDLVCFAEQIANGMDYIISKSIIHGDLAARNVLLTRNKTVKISDFGLSRKLHGNREYVKTSETPVPWRWMAVESLNSLTFSSASDVWSYGVTLYEIFTLGDTPFPMEEWNADFQAKLEAGMRMGRPKYSTPEIYAKMGECWENDPLSRPNFLALRLFFTEMANKFGSNQRICETSVGPQEAPPATRGIRDEAAADEDFTSYIKWEEMNNF